MRIYKKYLAAMLIVYLVVLISTYVKAEDGFIGRTPEGVCPMKEAKVRMESENIIVDLEQFTADCTFVFHNTGEEKNVLMGFPGRLRNEKEFDFPDDVSLSLENFKTFVKGVELPVKREEGVQPDIDMPYYSEWFTFSVPFMKDETITVRNTYNFNPSYDSTGDVLTGYVLQTGATWKDSIDKARVEFKLGSIQPWEIERLWPGGFRFEGNSIIWERTDIEPSYDLVLYFNTWRYSKECLESSDTNKEEKNMSLSKMNKYKKVKELAESKKNEELLNEYKSAEESRNTALAVYISSFLPDEYLSDGVPALGDVSVIQNSGNYHIDCENKDLYTVSTLLQISHLEDDNIIIDLICDVPYCDMFFEPGIEYDISIAVTDWLDRKEEKTIKYKAPEALPAVKCNDFTNDIDAVSENRPEVHTDSSQETQPETGGSKVEKIEGEGEGEGEGEKADNNVAVGETDKVNEIVKGTTYVWMILSALGLACIAAVIIISIKHKA